MTLNKDESEPVDTNSPAYKAACDRGCTVGCQILWSSALCLCLGGQIQHLDIWAAAPEGDYFSGGHAGVASVVHSTSIEGKGQAC